MDLTASTEPLVARLERAVRRFRLQSAHNLLDEAFAAYPAEEIVRRVGRPLLQRLDDPAAHQFASSLLELRLLAHARGWERVNGPRVVLACSPSDEDVLELIALGIGLAERHCRIDYLGAATPLDVLIETSTRPPAALAVVHGTLTRRETTRLKRLPCPLVRLGAAALDPDRPDSLGRIAGLARRESSRASDEASPT